MKGRSSAKENDNAVDEYYDIEDSWIDDGSLDEYFEPCDEAEEYQGFYVNQREVVSHRVADGAEKRRASPNNVLKKKKKQQAKKGPPAPAEPAAATKRKAVPGSASSGGEGPQGKEKKKKKKEGAGGGAPAAARPAAAGGSGRDEAGREGGAPGAGPSAAATPSRAADSFKKYKSLDAVMVRMGTAAGAEREKRKNISVSADHPATARNVTCSRSTTDLFGDIESELEAIEARLPGTEDDRRVAVNRLRKSVVDELVGMLSGVLKRDSITRYLKQARRRHAGPADQRPGAPGDAEAARAAGSIPGADQGGADGAAPAPAPAPPPPPAPAPPAKKKPPAASPRKNPAPRVTLDELHSMIADAKKQPKPRALAAPTVAPTDVTRK